MSPKKGHPVSYARCVFHRVFLYCGRISRTCIDRTAGFAQKNTAQGEFTLCGISFYSGLVFKFRICKVQITDGTQRGELALHFNANSGSAGNTQAQRACEAVHRERGNFILQMVVHINANRADKIVGGIALHDPCSRQALILSVRGVFGVDGFCDDRVQREVKAVAVRIAVCVMGCPVLAAIFAAAWGKICQRNGVKRPVFFNLSRNIAVAGEDIVGVLQRFHRVMIAVSPACFAAASRIFCLYWFL